MNLQGLQEEEEEFEDSVEQQNVMNPFTTTQPPSSTFTNFRSTGVDKKRYGRNPVEDDDDVEEGEVMPSRQGGGGPWQGGHGLDGSDEELAGFGKY